MTATPGRLLLGLAAATAALALPGTAGAHALVTKSEPADGSRLDNSPRVVRIWFSEDISHRFRSAQLLGPKGHPIAGVRVRARADPSSSIAVELPRLRRGAYALVWHAVSEDDGHATSGTLLFGVRMAVAPSAARTTDGVAPSIVDIALRWLRFSFIAILIGAVAFAGLVLRWAGPSADAEIVDRARRRILGVAGACGVLALAVEVGVFVRQTFVVASADGSGAWAARARDIWFSSRWGMLWLAEILLLGLFAAVVWRARNRRGVMSLGSAAAGAICAIGVAAVEALGSHAASSPASSAPVAADALHILAASIWMGGVASFLLACWPRDRFTRGESARLAVALRKPFALLAGGATLALVVTGLFAAGVEVSSIDGLLLTLYGRTLLAKSALFALAGALGVCNFILLSRLAGGGRRRVARVALVAEVVVGTAAFLAAGVLTASVPARGSAFSSPSKGVPLTLSRQIQDVVVTVTVRPNRPGTNTISIVAASTRRPAPAPIESVQAWLDSRGVAASPRKVAGGGWLMLAALGRRTTEQFTVAVRRDGRRLVAPFTWRVGRADVGRRVVVSSRQLAPIVDRAALLLLLGVSICLVVALIALMQARARPRPAHRSPRLEGFS